MRSRRELRPADRRRRLERLRFLDRDGRVKHYGISRNGPAPRRELVAATRRAAAEAIPDGAYVFTIAHDAATAGLGIVYWWANENAWHGDVLRGGDTELSMARALDEVEL